ncbi:MAG: hypothetical protein NVV63_18480 [Opitutus sp.]|nr:hypothetical protein [Opitutus sp.]
MDRFQKAQREEERWQFSQQAGLFESVFFSPHIRSVMVVVAVRRIFLERLTDHGAGAAVPSFLLLGGIPTGGGDRLDRSDPLPERKKGTLAFETEAGFYADFRPRWHSHHSLAWTLRGYLVRYRTMKNADPAGTDNERAAPARV